MNTPIYPQICNRMGCNNPLPAKKPGHNNGGRYPLFCSDKCRKAFKRDEKKALSRVLTLWQYLQQQQEKAGDL